MNDTAVIEVEQPVPLPAHTGPADLLRIAVEKNMPLEAIQRFMDLQDRWEAAQARKAFNVSMARFHEQHIRVVRSSTVRQGPLNGTKYAKLSDFVGAAAEALSEAGLSISWRMVQDAKDWIEVACVVRHVDGHEEVISMGGPPDAGGAKNAIQARASTVSYLEKYTLKMALGLAEQDDDDDGNGGPENAGQHRPTAKDDLKPEAKPEYGTEAFDRNFPKWAEAIKAGKKNHGQIITMAETRGKLTDEQKKLIREVKADATA